MNVIEIPFAKKVGIKKNDNGNLVLPFTKDVQNHLQTFHASAQFALAETSCGEILQAIFPELVDKVIPVLRESQIKFKKSTNKNISAYPSISNESRIKFNEQFSRKGRGLISVKVEVRDTEDTVTCICNFNWFVQKIEI